MWCIKSDLAKFSFGVMLLGTTIICFIVLVVLAMGSIFSSTNKNTELQSWLIVIAYLGLMFILVKDIRSDNTDQNN